MQSMAADGPALVAAAVRAAVQAKAPRRTVAATAAAVTSALLAAARSSAAPGTRARAGTGRTAASPSDGASVEAIAEVLQAARSARRQRKRARQRVARRERQRAAPVGGGADGAPKSADVAMEVEPAASTSAASGDTELGKLTGTGPGEPEPRDDAEPTIQSGAAAPREVATNSPRADSLQRQAPRSRFQWPANLASLTGLERVNMLRAHRGEAPLVLPPDAGR